MLSSLWSFWLIIVAMQPVFIVTFFWTGRTISMCPHLVVAPWAGKLPTCSSGTMHVPPPRLLLSCVESIAVWEVDVLMLSDCVVWTCMYMCMMHVCSHMHMPQYSVEVRRKFCWSWFALSTLQVPGIPDSGQQAWQWCLYWLSHLTSPNSTFMWFSDQF